MRDWGRGRCRSWSCWGLCAGACYGRCCSWHWGYRCFPRSSARAEGGVLGAGGARFGAWLEGAEGAGYVTEVGAGAGVGAAGDCVRGLATGGVAVGTGATDASDTGFTGVEGGGGSAAGGAGCVTWVGAGEGVGTAGGCGEGGLGAGTKPLLSLSSSCASCARSVLRLRPPRRAKKLPNAWRILIMRRHRGELLTLDLVMQPIVPLLIQLLKRFLDFTHVCG